jgi:hypothetical protein
VVLWHYYVDGKIWKFGRAPELASVVHEPLPATPGVASAASA